MIYSYVLYAGDTDTRVEWGLFTSDDLDGLPGVDEHARAQAYAEGRIQYQASELQATCRPVVYDGPDYGA